MRVVIIITPGAPRRAKQKGRARPDGMAAVDKVQRKDDVIAAQAPRPVRNAHAVLRRDERGRESPCVAIRRGHGKPHAASTCLSGEREWRGDMSRRLPVRPGGLTEKRHSLHIRRRGGHDPRFARDQTFSPQKAGRHAGKDTVSVGVLASAWADGNLHHPIKMGECGHIATVCTVAARDGARLTAV